MVQAAVQQRDGMGGRLGPLWVGLGHGEEAARPQVTRGPGMGATSTQGWAHEDPPEGGQPQPAH